MAKRRLSRRQLQRIHNAQDARRHRARDRAVAAAEAGTDGLGPEQTGLVIANYGTALVVEDASGSPHRCVVRQNLGAVVCGDRVVWQSTAPAAGVVCALGERHSLLQRPDFGGTLKPVAANVEQVAVVFAPRPELNEFLIDRYLVAIEALGVDILLLLNKVDLLDDTGRQEFEQRLGVYRDIGYRLLTASTRSATGLQALSQNLQGKTSVLVGQSGVGKSSLINALLPDLDIRVQALSAATGLGTHTTTTSMLYHLTGGGSLIDSPGVRSFEPGAVAAAAVEYGFVEFRPLLGHCKFSDCSHTVEPGCALLAAVAEQTVDPRRLSSLQQIRSAAAEREKP